MGILALLGAIIAGGIGVGIAKVLPRDRLGYAPPLSPSAPPPTPAASPSSSPRSPQATRSASPKPSPSPTRGPAKPLHVESASAYDPLGDGQEYDGLAPLAIDGDPGTTWRTERYTTADLGGLKRGVGLLLDLGRPHPVRVAHLTLLAGGANVQLRAGNAASLDRLRVVKTVTQASRSLTVRPPKGTKARYWLVWFTRLPPGDGGYRGGVAEVGLAG